MWELVKRTRVVLLIELGIWASMLAILYAIDAMLEAVGYSEGTPLHVRAAVHAVSLGLIAAWLLTWHKAAKKYHERRLRSAKTLNER